MVAGVNARVPTEAVEPSCVLNWNLPPLSVIVLLPNRFAPTEPNLSEVVPVERALAESVSVVPEIDTMVVPAGRFASVETSFRPAYSPEVLATVTTLVPEVETTFVPPLRPLS